MAFSKSSGIDMVCVGPEVPLVAGKRIFLRRNGIKVFGPSKAAALLEGSKVFAKTVMTKYGIPTADYKDI
jgi:phosphoribosylamine--glycine ligase